MFFRGCQTAQSEARIVQPERARRLAFTFRGPAKKQPYLALKGCHIITLAFILLSLPPFTW